MKAKSFAEVLQHPFVVIYDTANGNRLHKTTCSFVTETNFNTKVVINQEKNGYYRSLLSIEEMNDSSIKPCGVCKP